MYKRFLSILILATGLSFAPDLLAAEPTATNSPSPTAPATVNPASAPEVSAANDAFRSYLQLQEQLHETRLAIERAEREMELTTLKSALILSNRLQAIEQTVELQRAHELEMVRAMMLISGAFVVIGVFALLLTAYFHWRAVSRLGEIAAALPGTRGLGALPPLPALGLGENQLLLEQTNHRLVGALERLEKRIAELEHGEVRHLTNGQTARAALEAQPPPAAAGPEMSVGPATTSTTSGSSPADQVATRLARGSTLLLQDQAEPALACFEEALALNPKHPEALVKKGDALEKLRRTKEAIECYDRAIAIDDSMTIAYLHKGGLLNRLERFDEAMHCYEKALRTQEKERTA